MNIVQALQDDNENLRVSNFSRWLYWDTAEELWTVCERKLYQKKTKVIYKGANQYLAVDALLERKP